MWLSQTWLSTLPSMQAFWKLFVKSFIVITFLCLLTCYYPENLLSTLKPTHLLSRWKIGWPVKNCYKQCIISTKDSLWSQASILVLCCWWYGFTINYEPQITRHLKLAPIVHRPFLGMFYQGIGLSSSFVLHRRRLGTMWSRPKQVVTDEVCA